MQLLRVAYHSYNSECRITRYLGKRKCSSDKDMLNQDFLDYIACLSVAISIVNYKENLEQSTNDDLMKAIDEKRSSETK